MKRALLFSLLLFCPFFACAAGGDSLVVKKLIAQGDAEKEDPAAAHQFFKQAQKISANSETLKTYYAEALFGEAFPFFREGEYQKAIDNCTEAVAIFTALEKMNFVARCYAHIGLCWQYLNDYQKSLQFLFRALKIAEETGEKKLVGKIYTNIALAYESIEDWDNALTYDQKSLAIKKQLGDTLGLVSVYHNIANTYYYQKKDAEALRFFRLAMAGYVAQDDSPKIAMNATDLGNLLTAQKQYDSAIFYHQLALRYLEQHKEASSQGYCLGVMGIAHAYVQQGSLQKAAEWISKCVPCETEADFSFRKSLFELRYEYYKKTGNTAAALKNLEWMQQMDDSLSQESKNFENQRIAIRYEFGKKAEADSLKYQLQLAGQQRTTAEYRGRMYMLATLALLVASVAGFFYTRSKLNRKRELIAQQQAQLSESKALRAQMNPHFIFNCLNTIDSFVLQNKQQDASRLIQRFSKLSRRVLEHTTENTITVQQELDTLRIYLEIEQVRKAGQFRFEIEADPSVLAYSIPPMLLQPFVENAVLHGMKGIPAGEGLIRIEGGKDEKCAFFQITDNGIGRRRAMELKAAQPETHKSLSMEITLQRLQALHGHARQEEYIRFTDLEAPLQGTSVRITIPLTTDASC